MARPTDLLAAVVLTLVVPAAGARAATVSATADPTSLERGKTVRYVISLKGAVGEPALDLAPLEKDFDIVSQDRQRRAAVAGGRRLETVEWTLTLAPKAAGKLTIPALAVAGLRTAPVAITVTDVPTDRTSDGALSLQVEIGKGPIYVQSDVPVTMRVYDALGIRDGSFSELTADGAVMVQQGQPSHRFETIKNRKFHVIEQRYIMRPQRSGTVEIRPVTIEANVPTPNGLLSSTDPQVNLSNAPLPLSRIIDPGRDVTLRTKAIVVDVQARPAEVEGWFLPARNVTLQATWTTPLAQARVGAALTRVIRLEATGASPNQLPTITPPDVDAVRQYEDSSRTEPLAVKGETGAVRITSLSVVPVRPGDVTLPAIEVPWWNTDARRIERAVLPAETLHIAPDPRAATPPTPPPVAAADTSARPTVDTPAEPTLAGRIAAMLAHVDRTWVAGGVAILLLIAGARWLLRLLAHRPRRTAATARRRPRRGGCSGRAGRAAPRSWDRALAAACKDDDPVAAHHALLIWARTSPRKRAGGAPADPAELARTAELRAAIGDLRRHLYGRPDEHWQGEALLAATRAELRARKPRRQRQRGARLAPLYPERRA